MKLRDPKNPHLLPFDVSSTLGQILINAGLAEKVETPLCAIRETRVTIPGSGTGTAGEIPASTRKVPQSVNWQVVQAANGKPPFVTAHCGCSERPWHFESENLADFVLRHQLGKCDGPATSVCPDDVLLEYAKARREFYKLQNERKQSAAQDPLTQLRNSIRAGGVVVVGN